MCHNCDILFPDKVFDMNQQKALQLLNTIMPDISTSGDPGSVMLKCAKANNLAPAQLEKLAQVFNTMKTNFFMDHQANRGDSFPLVNVPELMSKYATYTPVADAAPTLPADTWSTTFKYASGEGPQLPTLEDAWRAQGFKVQDDSAGWQEVSTKAPEYDIMHKAAAVPAPKMPSREELRRAYDNASQARFESSVELRDKMAALAEQFIPDNGAWAEAVEDTMFGLGKEAAVAVNLVEDYFDNKGYKFKGADLAKRAGANVLARDRHNVWKDMKEICELVDMQKEANALMEELNAHLEKLAFPVPPPGNTMPDPGLPRAGAGLRLSSPIGKMLVENPLKASLDSLDSPTTRQLTEAIVAPSPVTAKEKKWKDDMMKQTERDVNLSKLLMSDNILREADPTKVKELYDTIADVSPTLASNPLLMGPTLKEALQYDAIPVQMLKDLVSIEKDQLDRKKNQTVVDRDAYGK